MIFLPKAPTNKTLEWVVGVVVGVVLSTPTNKTLEGVDEVVTV